MAKPGTFEPEQLLATVNMLEVAALQGEEATIRQILSEIIEGSDVAPVGKA